MLAHSQFIKHIDMKLEYITTALAGGLLEGKQDSSKDQ